MPTTQEWRIFYDRWAGRDPRLASTGRIVAKTEFIRLGQVFRGWLDLRGDERALDVGCASGTLMTHWAVYVGECTGIDLNSKLIVEAKRLHRGGNCRFHTAEAAALPFAAASFNVVVCFGVLLSLPDHDYVQRAIAEIERVASADARVLLGSLPDERCQQRFFEVLHQEMPWPRRWLSRIKQRLRGSRPRKTKILWFDIEALRRDLERRGWQVELHIDPPLENHRHYRRSLVLRRGNARW
jgi:ubiquinone/menaquinone biosynthesis C-methylase UbiE